MSEETESPRKLEEDVHARQVLRLMEAEWNRLDSQRTAILNRMQIIRRTTENLASIFGEDILGSQFGEIFGRSKTKRITGLTAACRLVLMEAKEPLRLHEVCDRLASTKLESLNRHKKFEASVRTVLGRLVTYGELLSVSKAGHPAWKARLNP